MFSREELAQGKLFVGIVVVVQLIKTDNVMKITGIDLFYYPPSIFYNYNDDFCLFHPLCWGKSNGKSVTLRPFYKQFLPQDHGAERPLYKSEILLRVKKVGIN